jgi:hypothetical protein
MIVARITGMLEPAVSIKKIAKGIDKSAAYLLSFPLSLIRREVLMNILAIQKKKAVMIPILDPDIASM